MQTTKAEDLLRLDLKGLMNVEFSVYAKVSKMHSRLILHLSEGANSFVNEQFLIVGV